MRLPRTRSPLSCLALIGLLACFANADEICFSMDIASPSNRGAGPRAHQVVEPGLAVKWSAPAGVDVDAISPGHELWLPEPCEFIVAPAGNYLATLFWWSVDRPAIGGDAIALSCPPVALACFQFGNPVEREAALTEAAGDIFLNTFDPDRPCDRIRIVYDDEEDLGEDGPPLPIDDLNALSITGPPKYFSVSGATAGRIGVSGASIMKRGSGSSYSLAFAPSDLGLTPSDDIDALSVGPLGVLFSLAPGSPSLAIFGAGPGDVFWGDPSLIYAPAQFFDLQPGENLNALHAIVGDPGQWRYGGVCQPVPDEYEFVELPGGMDSIRHDPQARVILPLCSDDQYVPVHMPFSFEFFSVPHNQVTVSVNGFATFGPMPPNGAYANTAIADPSLPNDMIAPFWDDLLAGVSPGPFSGEVLAMVDGHAPSRRLVIEWSHVGRWNRSSCNADGAFVFQLHLHEGTNEISIHYDPWTIPSSITPSATVGIEDAFGSGIDLTGLGAANRALPNGFLLRPNAVATGTTYGTGCNQNGEIPFFVATGGMPETGNSEFELTLAGAPPGIQALLLMGIQDTSIPVPLPGCGTGTLHTLPFLVLSEPMTGRGARDGTSVFELPIGNVPNPPVCLHVQGLTITSAGDFSLTNGLTLTIE